MAGGPSEFRDDKPGPDDRPTRPRSLSLLYQGFLLVIGLWLLYSLRELIVLFSFSIILSIVLNAPITWLERRHVHRYLGTTIVLLVLALALAGLGWLVFPRVAAQLGSLSQNLPHYLTALEGQVNNLLRSVGLPALNVTGASAGAALPSLTAIVGRIGRLSLTVLEVFVITLSLLSITLYLTASPRPVAAAYVRALPPEARPAHLLAFSTASQMTVGWIWANVLLGIMNAVSYGVFLALLGIPGALVWAALALFAELVPVLGAYITAIPPLIVALSVKPIYALWVLLFSLAFNLIKDHLVVPLIRAGTMQLNPVFILFVTVAMAWLFGLPGALVATPIAGFINAYYNELFLARRGPGGKFAVEVETMLESGLLKPAQGPPAAERVDAPPEEDKGQVRGEAGESGQPRDEHGSTSGQKDQRKE